MPTKRKRAGIAMLAAIWLATCCFGERCNRLVIEKPITEKDRSHWAFQPIRDIKPPKLRNESRASNGVDRFILSPLEAENSTLMPAADRRTLIRRLSFD